MKPRHLPRIALLAASKRIGGARARSHRSVFKHVHRANNGMICPVRTVTNTYEPNRDVVVTKQNRVTTGPNTNSIVSQYDYTVNALGQRTIRTQTGTALTTANTDNFTYNPRSEVVNSTNNLASTLNRSYNYDPIGNRLATTESDITNLSTKTYTSNSLNQYTQINTTLIAQPTYDADGNTSELIKPTGELDAHYQYDPFGQETTSTGPVAQTNPYRFSTKPLDNTVGLNYYGYRFYSPQLGRWINRDPMNESGGGNLYVIAGNDIVRRVDFLGLFWGCELIMYVPAHFYDSSYSLEWKVVGGYISTLAGSFSMNSIVTAERIEIDFERDMYISCQCCSWKGKITTSAIIKEKLTKGRNIQALEIPVTIISMPPSAPSASVTGVLEALLGLLSGAIPADHSAKLRIAAVINALRPEAWPGPRRSIPENLCDFTKEGLPE